MKVHELRKALIDLYTKIQDSQMAVFLVSLKYLYFVFLSLCYDKARKGDECLWNINNMVLPQHASSCFLDIFLQDLYPLQ